MAKGKKSAPVVSSNWKKLLPVSNTLVLATYNTISIVTTFRSRPLHQLNKRKRERIPKRNLSSVPTTNVSTRDKESSKFFFYFFFFFLRVTSYTYTNTK